MLKKSLYTSKYGGSNQYDDSPGHKSLSMNRSNFLHNPISTINDSVDHISCRNDKFEESRYNLETLKKRTKGSRRLTFNSGVGFQLTFDPFSL